MSFLFAIAKRTAHFGHELAKGPIEPQFARMGGREGARPTFR
jgi:hypothetical protein